MILGDDQGHAQEDEHEDVDEVHDDSHQGSDRVDGYHGNRHAHDSDYDYACPQLDGFPGLAWAARCSVWFSHAEAVVLH